MSEVKNLLRAGKKSRSFKVNLQKCLNSYGLSRRDLFEYTFYEEASANWSTPTAADFGVFEGSLDQLLKHFASL